MKSKLTQISQKQTQLKTAIPRGVQDIIHLKKGDYLQWIPYVEDGEIKIRVERMEE